MTLRSRNPSHAAAVWGHRLQWPQILTRPRSPWLGLAATIGTYVLLTVVLTQLLGPEQLIDVVLIYLLVCLVSAAIWGYAVGLVSAVAADALVNLFFVEPLHKLTVQQPTQTAALVLFLAVAGVGASMLSLLRRQVTIAAARQRETAILLDLAREAAQAITPRDAMERLCVAITRAVQAKGCAILNNIGGEWHVAAYHGDSAVTREDSALATEALRSGQVVGYGGRVRARVPSLHQHTHQRTLAYVPCRTKEQAVLRIDGTIHIPLYVDPDGLLRAFGDQASLAVHHARLAEEASGVEAMKREDEIKTALLSSVSHDLRSPLTAIKAAAGSLRMRNVKWTDADREQLLGEIESQTDRLTGTVSGLLDMSRLEAGNVRRRLEPIEALPFLSDAAQSAALTTTGRLVQLDAFAGVWFRADYALLHQALVNLIENAAKYSKADGAIWLRAKSGEGLVVLEVSDQGPGISPTDLPYIFDKFYRGAEGKQGTGSGLGLSIVRAMVELCGGRVNVESSPDGTTFRMSLPASAPAK